MRELKINDLKGSAPNLELSQGVRGSRWNALW
jgi:hypothetical protein